MARYDYRCTSCGTTFEVEHPMSAHPHVTCPSCGKPASRVFSASGITFKGSGFYNTDQRSSSKHAHSCSGCSGSSCATCAK
ncbi:MAG: FmdB family transcriptional regulator [Atopobiaceae bacterium]|jgi:putative FmdB family regulatory protein|nr:FmdB family transcriptional regulator [Atopobiaceae bacterium]